MTAKAEAVSLHPEREIQKPMNKWPFVGQVRSERCWGLDNLELIPENQFGSCLRVHYPAGSASPSFSRSHNVPVGGCGFLTDNPNLGDSAILSYWVRFPQDFPWAKGGKLPGLFGGNAPSGGNIPNGTNGWSVRLMWRRDGAGEAYAYLPTNEGYGTSIGRGNWIFRKNVWQSMQLLVKLNKPGQIDGQIRVQINQTPTLSRQGLIFRTEEKLGIDGVFFSSFFGGSDDSWATPSSTFIDFADFKVSSS